jgi:protein ImuB
MSRVLVVWCPDWPAMVHMAEREADTPLAVLASRFVLACTPAARAEGVRRGMRRRDAQSRCPDLVVVEHTPDADARAFEPVLTRIEDLSPGVAPIRPGLAALTVPARYYGGEAEAAAVLTEALVGDLGVWDVRCGIADGVFAAEQAARRAAVQDCLVVEPLQSAAFLAHLSVDVFDDAEFAGLLHRLGVHTLGDFAQLPAADVHTRFGVDGATRHRLARGIEVTSVARRAVPPDFAVQVAFEPPLDSAETLAFSTRRIADEFVDRLAEHGGVATAVRIELEGESLTMARTWRHPRWFGATDLVDRVRWQAPGFAEGVSRVRFVPELVESAGDHADGLFGGGTDEAVSRGVARVQSMIGPELVQSVALQGGRSPRERHLSTTWGERPLIARDGQRPWPGSIPAPAPSTVLVEPVEALVVGAEGQPVVVTGRGGLIGEPARVRIGATWHHVDAWAGPWPLDERWWDEQASRRIARFQVVGTGGQAWLMTMENSRWWLEAVYD